MRRTSPKPGLLAWWSTTTEVPAASTSTASSPRRPGEAASRLTNTSGEDGTADEGTNPSAPGSQPSDAGSANGSGNVARTRAPLRRSPSARASVLPRASASGWTCPERTTVARASAASLSTDEAVRRGETVSCDVVTGTGSGVRSGVGDRGCVLLLLHGAASHRVAAAVVRLVGGDARRIADLTVLAAVRRVSRVRRPAATQHGRAPTLVGLVGIGIVLAHDRSSLALVAAARGAAVPIGSLARSLTTAPRWRSSPPLAALLCPLVRSHARSRPLLAGARRRRSRRCCAHSFARSQSAPGLRGHIVGTVIGIVGGHRVMDGVRLEVLVELFVVLGRLLVGIGLPGVLRTLPRPGQLRVGVPGALERLLELAGGVGDDVGDEGQRRDELDAGLPADRRSQDPRGAGERRRRVRDLRLVAVHGVEDRGLAEVTGHPGVGDGHHAQAGVLDLVLDRGGDDLSDADRQLAGAGRIGHRTSSIGARRGGPGRRGGGPPSGVRCESASGGRRGPQSVSEWS